MFLCALYVELKQRLIVAWVRYLVFSILMLELLIFYLVFQYLNFVCVKFPLSNLSNVKRNKFMNFGDFRHQTVKVPDCIWSLGSDMARLSRNRVISAYSLWKNSWNFFPACLIQPACIIGTQEYTTLREEYNCKWLFYESWIFKKLTINYNK